jgi:hypothetical protein
MTELRMEAVVIPGTHAELDRYPDDEIWLRAVDPGGVQVIDYSSEDPGRPPAHIHPWHEIEIAIAPPIRKLPWCLLGATCALVLLWTGPASAHRYTYDSQARGDIRADFQRFRKIARDTLKDVRGWSLNLNMEFDEISSGEEVSSDEDRVYINDRRWRRSTPTWPGSLRDYRHYVVNHEVGHWLGLGHESCPGRRRDAPVMMQQSQGMDGCKPLVWPKMWERNRVAKIHDVDGWYTPRADAPFMISGPTAVTAWSDQSVSSFLRGRRGEQR